MVPLATRPPSRRTKGSLQVKNATVVLGRDLPDDRATLERHVQAWQHRRNATTRADWQFATKDARIKLRKLYPIMES